MSEYKKQKYESDDFFDCEPNKQEHESDDFFDCEPNKQKHESDDFFDCEPNKQHHDQIKIVTTYPVVLAEVCLQKDIFHVTEFSDFVLEINDVKKRLVITQCRLLLPTKKLFIKGFVRKNIQYTTSNFLAEQQNEDSCPPEQALETTLSEPLTLTSTLKSHTEFIDFELVTEIKKFNSKPVLPKNNSRKEFDFFVPQPLQSGYPEKDEMLSSDLSQFHQESAQYYNELPYCELISSNIIEWDEAFIGPNFTININGPSGIPIQESFFKKVDDKMVINFKIKILQNQQVSISSIVNEHECDYK